MLQKGRYRDIAILMAGDPVLPPRRKAIPRQGRWVRWAKIGFERYFLWKMRHVWSNLP